MILGARNDFRQEISNNLFGDAVEHRHVAKTDITANEVESDLQMPYVAKSSWIGRDMQTRHAIRVHPIWLGAGVPKKTHHVFGVDQLFTSDTGRHELCGTRGVDDNGLL